MLTGTPARVGWLACPGLSSRVNARRIRSVPASTGKRPSVFWPAVAPSPLRSKVVKPSLWKTPGKQAGPQDGQSPRIFHRPLIGPHRLEKGFEIDQHGVLARRDQVFPMEIVGFERVEQGHPGPLPLIESLDLRGGRAGSRRDEFHPAVRAPVEEPHGEKPRPGSPFVQPEEQLLEPGVHPEAPGLVDQPEPGGKGQESDRPAAVMTVAAARLEDGQGPRVAAAENLAHQVGPIGQEALQGFEARRGPLGDVARRLARQDGVAGQDREGLPAVAERLDEAVEAGLRRLPGELPFQAAHVELQNQGAFGHPAEPFQQMADEARGNRFAVQQIPSAGQAPQTLGKPGVTLGNQRAQGFEEAQAVREARRERRPPGKRLRQLEEPLRRIGSERRERGRRCGQGVQEESGSEAVAGEALGEQDLVEEAGLRAPALPPWDGPGRELGGGSPVGSRRISARSARERASYQAGSSKSGFIGSAEEDERPGGGPLILPGQADQASEPSTDNESREARRRRRGWCRTEAWPPR